MEKTKAALKALRETVGMAQRNLAAALGVEARSVKRWESAAAEGYPPLPHPHTNPVPSQRHRACCFSRI